MTRRRRNRLTPRRSSLVLAGVALTAIASSAVTLAGCFSTENGPPPPQTELYFPTGLIVSPKGLALYVVNSDFDLQFKAGTVLALDLNRIRDKAAFARDGVEDIAPPPGTASPPVGPPCVAAGLRVNDGSGALLYPSACSPIDLISPGDKDGSSLIKTAVDIGAFAADVALALRPPGDPTNPKRGARLMIPVRGDPSLTWIDVDDDRDLKLADGSIQAGEQHFGLSCDLDSQNRCGDSHRAGIDPGENTRSETMPSEPFALSISDDTSAIVVTHQTSGTASLFLNGWGETVDPNAPTSCANGPEKPKMLFVLGGLPTGVTGTAAFPQPELDDFYVRNQIGYSLQPGFLLGYRTAAELDVVRYYDDCASAPSRPFLVRTAAVGVYANASGFDSRSIALDAKDRKAAEADCGPKRALCETDLKAARDAATMSAASPPSYSSLPTCMDAETCLQSAAAVPVGIYVANRLPPSLLVGETIASVSRYGTSDSVRIKQQIPLSVGASRVQFGEVIGHDGQPEARIFILCFDSRLLYVFDPASGTIEGVVTTGRGPAAFAFPPPPKDTAEPDATGIPRTKHFGYLAHFTDSYIGVLDLDMRHRETYLTFVANVGSPQPPRESKLISDASSSSSRRIRRVDLGALRLRAEADRGPRSLARAIRSHGARLSGSRRRRQSRVPHGRVRDGARPRRRRQPATGLRARDADDAR